jgi:hypothetical protein
LIEVSGSTVNVRGYFTRVGGTAHDYLVALDATSGKTRNLAPECETQLHTTAALVSGAVPGADGLAL